VTARSWPRLARGGVIGAAASVALHAACGNDGGGAAATAAGGAAADAADAQWQQPGDPEWQPVPWPSCGPGVAKKPANAVPPLTWKACEDGVPGCTRLSA
jgi:hypothetical protein